MTFPCLKALVLLILLIQDLVHGFSAPFLSTTHAESSTLCLFAVDRRFAIQSAALVVASSLTLPVNAAYIEPDIPKITKRVYLDVQIGDQAVERLSISLFGEQTPRLVDNFVQLCENNAYAGTTFYRVLSDLNIQGGAVGDKTGKTGQSAFGAPFEPDNYDIKHSKEGLVSAVRGVGGSADSRFFINCKDEAGWADDRYAAFGIVDAESMSVVRNIEKVPVRGPGNAPKVDVNIVACGILP